MPQENIMRKQILLAAGWLALLSALLAMIIGHGGSSDLSWETNQISTYAATSARQAWITTAITLPCLALICISILVSRSKILGDTYLAHAVPLLAGAAISGLCTLAAFKETARTISILKNSGFDAVRQQSFHDAGLLIFFYSAILLAVLLGILIIRQTAAEMKMVGALVVLLGLAAFPLMSMPWPGIMGITSAVPGLKQRASLFSLWLAIALVLVVASKDIFRSSYRR